MKTVITHNNQILTLEDKPLGSGGSGDVYRIINPRSMQKYCVKIYNTNHRTSKIANKIQYQIKNPPTDIMGASDFVLCWPISMVFDNQKNFLGFIMPLAFADSVSLKILSTGAMPKITPDDIKAQYSRETSIGGLNRLNMCVNLAHAVHKLHVAGYVVIDLKPENFMVTKLGKISVLDLDNVQVSDKITGSLIHHAELATMDYQPVEGLIGKADPQKTQIAANWDYFSLAVIFYQILYGTHPYRATFKPPFDNIQSEHKAVEHGLYVYGSKSRFVEAKPHSHDKLLQTPKSIQTLFIRAFDIGHEKPESRPNAQEFGKLFYEVYNALKHNTKTPNTLQNQPIIADNQKTPPPTLPPKLAAKFTKQPVSTHHPNNTPKTKTTKQINQTKKQSANKVIFAQKTTSSTSTAKKNSKGLLWFCLIVAALWILTIIIGNLTNNYNGSNFSSPDNLSDGYDAKYDSQSYTNNTTNQFENTQYINRLTHAPNGMPYPDGAGHIEGYPKLSTNGNSIVTVLNDKNDFVVFGKLVRLYNYAIEVRYFYIPPYGGLNLRDLEPGTYELRYENVNQNSFFKTDSFVLAEQETMSGLQYTHLNIKLYDSNQSQDITIYSIPGNEF